MRKLTPTQAKKYFLGKTITFESGDIQVYKDKGRTVWIDNRTEHKNSPEASIVYPFALDDYHVFIICPYCGEFHVHGNVKGDYEGHRTSHCGMFSDHPDYYIKALRSKED